MKNILTILLFLPFIAVSQTRPILFYDDAENAPSFIGTNCPTTNAPFSNGWTSRQGDNSTSSITYSTAFARKGTGSYAMTIRPSSNNNWQFMKAELAWNFLPAGSTFGVLGCNAAFSRPSMGLRWVAASTYIPVTTNFPSDPNFNLSFLFNTKADPDYGTTSYMVINSGRYRLVVATVAANGSLSYAAYDCGPVVKGVWVDWALHRNFVQNSTGYVELYKDGERLHRITGSNWRTVGYSREPYMQMGLYRFSTLTGSAITIHYDEFRFGDSTITDVADVSPQDVTPVNNPPLATITPDVIPTNTTTAQAIARVVDDGTITDRAWAYQSGPMTPSQTGTSGDTLRLSNITLDGEYVYRFIATDNGGLRDTAFVTIVKSTARTVIFYNGAENSNDPVQGGIDANIEQFFSGNSGDNRNTITRVTDIVRSGTHSYQFIVTDTTAVGFQYNGKELVWNFRPPTGANTIQWQGVSLYIPESMRGDATPTTVGMNALRFNQEDKAHYLDIINGRWYFTFNRWSSTGTFLGTTRVDVGEVEYGKWVDWAVHRNYTSTNTGFIRVYRNKFQVYATTGSNYSAAGSRPEPYFHMGIWKPALDSSSSNNKSTITINIDNIAFGGSLATIDDISPNQAPTVQIDPIPDTNADTVTLGALLGDIDGTVDSLVWLQLAGPASTIIGTGDTVQAVLTDTGTYRFQLIATDNQQAVTGATVTVRKFADAVNTPPTVDVPESGFYQGSNSVVLTATASDAEGPVTYQWFIENGPANARLTLTNDTTASVTISGFKPGTYQVRVRVTDSEGLTAEKTSTIIYRLVPQFFFIYSGKVNLILK